MICKVQVAHTTAIHIRIYSYGCIIKELWEM